MVTVYTTSFNIQQFYTLLIKCTFLLLVLKTNFYTVLRNMMPFLGTKPQCWTRIHYIYQLTRRHIPRDTNPHVAFKNLRHELKYQLQVSWGVKLATHLFKLPKLRMNGGITPTPHMPSWCGQGQICLFIRSHMTWFLPMRLNNQLPIKWSFTEQDPFHEHYRPI